MRFTLFLFLMLPIVATAQKSDTAKHKLSVALSGDYKTGNYEILRVYKKLCVGLSEDIIVQNYAHYINKSVKSYDSHTTIFLKLNF